MEKCIFLITFIWLSFTINGNASTIKIQQSGNTKILYFAKDSLVVSNGTVEFSPDSLSCIVLFYDSLIFKAYDFNKKELFNFAYNYDSAKIAVIGNDYRFATVGFRPTENLSTIVQISFYSNEGKKVRDSLYSTPSVYNVNMKFINNNELAILQEVSVIFTLKDYSFLMKTMFAKL
ncbi:MAG: hypothetical protein IPF75_12170 [Bacteroidetes bacterium]|nr:hypothetical protein [Bacteroidota bacterium]